MRMLKWTPVVVVGLVLFGLAASWLAGRFIVEREGFAGAAGVALWLLGSLALAFLVALAAAVVTVARYRTLSRSEVAGGALPLPLLALALLAVLFWVR